MERENTENPLPSYDPLTIVSIGLLAGALTGFIHEGLGHGGACLLVGGKPTLLTSMNFVWDNHGFPAWALRAVSAGGTIANLLAGALALALLRRPRFTAHLYYFVWLFVAVNLYGGYGLLLVLRREQYWRLGKFHCWAAIHLALARVAGFAWGKQLLFLRKVHAGKGRAINRRRPGRSLIAAPIC